MAGSIEFLKILEARNRFVTEQTPGEAPFNI
jgi:hypothetical protein